MSDEEKYYQSLMQSYKNMTDQGSAIKIRIDTTPLLEMIEMELKSQKIVRKVLPDGNVIEVAEQIPELKPKMNELGISATLFFIKGVINQHTVQGYITKDEYTEICFRISEHLNDLYFRYYHKFELDIFNYESLIETISNMVRLFLSRVIEGNDKKSLGIMKIVENVIHSQQSKSQDPMGLK